MSDESDVRDALVFLADMILPPFRVGGTVRLYGGWPNEQGLDADIRARVDNVSVFPDPRMQRNATRYTDPDLTGPRVITPTLGATVAGRTVTLAGVPAAGQVVGVVTGHATAYAYPVQAGDTLASVAQAVAALCGGLAAGAVVTVPPSPLLIARVGGAGSTVYEGARIYQVFRVTAWSCDPHRRDALGSALMQHLAGIQWLQLPDQAARMRFVTTSTRDDATKLSLYRRDILLSVEYAATTVVAGTTMILPDVFTAATGSTYG